MAGPARRGRARWFRLRPPRTRGGGRRARPRRSAGPVRADRHRVGNDRQKRYRRTEVTAAARVDRRNRHRGHRPGRPGAAQGRGRRRRRRDRAGCRAGRAAADRRGRGCAAAGARSRRRVGRGAGQLRPDPALRTSPARPRERQRRRRPGGRAEFGAGPRADVAGRRGGGWRNGLRGRRRGLCQGAAAVRAHHRHFPSGEAPLREHAGGRRVGGRRGVGCLARGSRGLIRGRNPVPAGGRGGGRPGVPRLCAQRGAEHSGARRHRFHLGARRASASAPRAGDRGAVRR